MEIFKLFLIVNYVVLHLSLSLAEDETKAPNENTPELDLINLSDADDESEGVETHRKRDSGYPYSKPNVAIFKGSKPYSTKSITQTIKPFNRYGPPPTHVIATVSKKPSSQQINHGSSSWYQQKYRHGFSNNGAPLSESVQSPTRNYQHVQYSLLKVPSPIRDVDFKGPNPIASQNNEPFQPNFANYLPPKNQKLPGYSSSTVFEQYQSNNVPKSQEFNVNADISLQNENISENVPENPQISDGTFFLIQNAEALSQLYSSPAANVNYPPFENSQSSNNQEQDQNSNLEKFEGSSLEQPRNLGHTSAIFNTLNDVNKLQTQQTKAFIAQLQQTLASFQPNNADIRYAQSYGDILHNPHIVSSIPTLQLHRPSPSNVFTFQTQGIPGDGSKKDETPISTFAGSPTPTFPPSQIGNVFPFLITNNNFASDIPNHGSAVSESTTSHTTNLDGSSPTHFGLPLPTIPSNNPNGVTAPPTTTSRPATPGSSKPEHRPIQPFPIRPTHVVPATSTQPIFPVVPSVTQIQNPSVPIYPTYGIQSTPINTILVKPLKPVYPIYYYTNPAYRLLKPLSPTYQWNYAPSYAQTKPGSIC